MRSRPHWTVMIERSRQSVPFSKPRVLESLTPREREVLQYVSAGLMDKQTASDMGIAEITAKIHRGQAMRKMN